MAVRSYKCEKRKKWKEGIDLTASDGVSEEKILLRVIEPTAKAGFVGVDAVKKMSEVMKLKEYDRGFLVGKKFTEAAEQVMIEQKIQRISEDYMPPVTPERLYLTINEYVNGLCKKKCGEIPQKESDCDACSKGQPCNVKTISDNATFHFEKGWIDLLGNDFKKLAAINDTSKPVLVA